MYRFIVRIDNHDWLRHGADELSQGRAAQERGEVPGGHRELYQGGHAQPQRSPLPAQAGRSHHRGLQLLLPPGAAAPQGKEGAAGAAGARQGAGIQSGQQPGQGREEANA